MYDSYGRKIEYMRISVTDRCNLRCRYCMPDGIENIPMSEILTFEEIAKVCSSAAELGIRHIRLTGGEPLVRKQAETLVGMLKNIDGIESVTMTTNGILLAEKLDILRKNGLDGVNISLDTLDSERYKMITCFDRLSDVMKSIASAEESGLPTKINTVVLEENADEWLSLAELAKNRNVDVRFIEIMPIGNGKSYKSLSCENVYNAIKKKYDIKPYEYPEKIGYGPAEYYEIDGFKGKIGFINAVHEKFCGQCNRIRLTSTGFLKSCLCYDDGADLKSVLRGKTDKSPKDVIYNTVYNKPEGHCFDNESMITEKSIMSEIGG